MNATRLSRSERVARGAVATVIAVVFAAVSHVAAGAHVPSVAALAVTIVVVLPLSIALAGVRLSFARLATLIIIGQGLFHFTFAMIGLPSSAAASLGSHAAHGQALGNVSLAESAQLFEALAVAPTSASTVMWISHLVAALATLLLLRRGEQAAIALITIVRASLRSLGASMTVSITLGAYSLRAAPLAPAAQPVQLRLARRACRRGPPLLSA